MTNLKLPLRFHKNPPGCDARSVANILLQRAKNDFNELTPLQVIKLVYLCQGWSLALLDKSLFRQNVEAWMFGPVVKDIYDDTKKYIDQPVKQYLRARGDKLDDKSIELITAVYNEYKMYNGPQLIRITHKRNSPWAKIWRNKETKRDIIPNTLIKEYFLSLEQDYYRENPEERQRQP